MSVTLITDGACSGNPGPGGWGALLRHNGNEKLLSGYEANSTNNRMELTAVIEGLRALTRPCTVHIVTDSKYVMDGIEKWLPSWKRKKWRTAAGTPVKNRELWEALDAELQKHQTTWEWVKGHNGHPDNERVDEAARQAIADHR